MKPIASTIFAGFISLLMFSCGTNSSDKTDESKKPIVSIGDDVLYKGELEEALPLNITGNDSITAADKFIRMWINERLLYNKAKQNIVNEEHINQLVEDYKKSLITNSYQERLIKEHFSNVISENELKAYYDQNKDKFKLEDNIIKGLYLKVPVNSSQLSNFQKWYKLGTDAAIENIEKNTLQNAVNYEFFYDKWVSFTEVIENIPTSISNSQQFLKGNKNLEVRDSSFVYLLNIRDFKPVGTAAPYDYIRGQLADIYIERQKSDYINKLQTDLYDKAVAKGEIKFYKE